VTAAAGIAPVRIAGPRVTIRPLTEPEVADVVRHLYEDPDGDIERYVFTMGPPPREAYRERLLGSGRFVNGILDLAIEAEGHLAGHVQARQPKECSPPGVYSLGIWLHGESRGRGFGSEAIMLITRHLFTQEDARRVELSTDVANGPMRTVAERVGFAFEGVLRSFMPTPGGSRDYALYAMTRDDWETKRTEWTRTS
jgi:RimJ/RimL family protein N-acetyltransferase